jgi:hypothetical protein
MGKSTGCEPLIFELAIPYVKKAILPYIEKMDGN